MTDDLWPGRDAERRRLGIAEPKTFLNGKVTVIQEDSRLALKGMADASIDSLVTDPPYALVSIVKRFGQDGAAACKVPENGTGAYARASAGFMGKKWDTGETAFCVEFWAEVLRVLKPGGHILAFGGTRTYHRLAVAIEDAGFEIRDQIAWLYGSGFPKSHDVSKGIDRQAGADRPIIAEGPPVARMIPGADQNRNGWEKTNGRVYVPTESAPATEAAQQWQGWGTALKPALEPIVLARKPLIGTVAANVLKHGTGAINVDGCRVGTDGGTAKSEPVRDSKTVNAFGNGLNGGVVVTIVAGRWPANVIHDGSAEVLAGFPDTGLSTGGGMLRDGINNNVYGAQVGHPQIQNVGHGDSGSAARFFYTAKADKGRRPGGFANVGAAKGDNRPNGETYSDLGSAARFFYTAKADSDDRIGSKHPTVKPVDLMRYLCRLITPQGGTVLDPFAGTGTTGEAAWLEGFRCILIEREAEYIPDIERRMALCLAGPDEKTYAIVKAKGLTEGPGPLFDGLDE